MEYILFQKFLTAHVFTHAGWKINGGATIPKRSDDADYVCHVLLIFLSLRVSI
jgi:hypothetical protein